MNQDIRSRGSFGFTLIELSIVLVIIGLIAGGILVGSSMIQGARLRATVTQIERYNAAANSFRLKYGYLPGDLPNAANGYGFTATDTNYKGDDLIEGCDGHGDTFGCETDAFWTQLSAAGLIADNLTDTTAQASFSTAAYTTMAGLLPQAKLGTDGGSNMNYVMVSINTLDGLGSSMVGSLNQNYYRIFIPSSVTANSGAINIPSYTTYGLKPADANAIDLKMDDGLPATGIVLGFDSFTTTTATGAAMYLSTPGSSKCQGATANTYNLSSQSSLCSLAIKASF